MNKIIKDIIYILVTVLVINVLSCFLFFRWDFTVTKRYSLSKVSKNIIRNNNEPVVVDFYVTEDLPQDIKKLAKEFQSLLKEYKSLSNSNFVINIINPDNTEKEFKAAQAGIKPIYNEIRERDLEQIQRIFIGAVFHIGQKQAVIPKINFDTPLEYEITRLFKQAADTLKPTIGFVRGHQEATFNHIPQLINELSHLTEMKVVDLNSPQSLNDCNVICIIDPKDSYSAYEIDRLDKYLDKGGRLFIALNHAIGQLGDRNSGYINRTGLEDMLEKKGLKIKFDFCR